MGNNPAFREKWAGDASQAFPSLSLSEPVGSLRDWFQCILISITRGKGSRAHARGRDIYDINEVLCPVGLTHQNQGKPAEYKTRRKLWIQYTGWQHAHERYVCAGKLPNLLESHTPIGMSRRRAANMLVLWWACVGGGGERSVTAEVGLGQKRAWATREQKCISVSPSALAEVPHMSPSLQEAVFIFQVHPKYPDLE